MDRTRSRNPEYAEGHIFGFPCLFAWHYASQTGQLDRPGGRENVSRKREKIISVKCRVGGVHAIRKNRVEALLAEYFPEEIRVERKNKTEGNEMHK